VTVGDNPGMQEFSFDFGDPVFDVDGWRLSLQVITFENTYGVPATSEVDRDLSRTTIRAPHVTYAGGQRSAAGAVALEAWPAEGGLELVLSASMPRRVRCTKVIVSGLPCGELLGHRWAAETVRRRGTTVHYPGTTHTPLIFLRLPDGEHLYFESLDARVRAKRFAVVERNGSISVELIHEDAAYEMSAETRSPRWRIGRTRDPGAVVRRREQHVARAFGLSPWVSRADIPPWARDVALVATIHGMHWSGYIFNSYDDMRGIIEYLADRMPRRSVLAFLAGWEGRYYWQYGDYRPEPLLGGDAGFRRLAARARDLGVSLMPMFGANCANRELPGFAEWGAGAEMCSPSGMVFQGNRPDWDASRSHDPGWQAWLNPGAPHWRQHLISQVSALLAAYDLPAAFFDTQHVWTNDPHYDVYGGLLALRDELKSRFPDLLLAGEGWYDALGAVTPMSHSGWPAAWPEFFGRYNRAWLHLSAGDPSRGSTGVHELGYRAYEEAPDVPWCLPSIAFVDGTLTRARPLVDSAIADAKRRAL